jgi:hypothetical protein
MQDTYRSYWQLAQAAATAKAEDGGYAYTVTDLVTAASQLARDAGLSLSFQEGSQLGSLFSIARANDRAGSELLSAAPDSRIKSSMVGSWPTAAPASVQAAQPEYMAKAQFTYTNALGEISTGWITMSGITHLPPSVSNLALRMQGAAQQAYAKTPDEGGTPKTDAEVMTDFGEFTDLQLYEV